MDKNAMKVMLSSNKKDYGTPKDKFGYLDSIFQFEIDLCAQENNKKLENYYSEKDDAFTKHWKGVCWMNPPFGEPEHPCKTNCKKKKCKERGHHNDEYVEGLIDWMEKASRDSYRYGSTIVCLVPCRPDTDWFQHIWNDAKIVCFVKGRWTFEGAPDPAPFPLVISVFGKRFDKNVTTKLQAFGNVISGNAVRQFKKK